MTLAVLLAGLLMMALAFAPARASAEPLCTNTWEGPAEGNWNSSADWSAGHAPTSTDVACIGEGKTVNVTEGEAHASVVQGKGTLALAGLGSYSLELVNAFEASNVSHVTMVGGTLKGPATLEVSGSLSWTGGVMAGSGSTVVGSGATGSVSGTLEGRTLVNKGTTTVGTAELSMGLNAKVENQGTFIANTESSFAIATGEEEISRGFENTGTFEKTANSGLTGIQVNFVNHGTVEASTGNLSFSKGGSGNSEAHWQASEGASIAFKQGSYVLSGGSWSGAISILGAASVTTEATTASAAHVIANGTWSVAAGSMTVATLLLNGTLTGAGTLNISGSLSWESGGSTMSGSGSTVVLSGASGTVGGSLINRTLVNEGTLTLPYSGTELFMGEGSKVKNRGTFIANYEASYAIGVATIDTSRGFVNTGTFEKTEGTGTTGVEPRFENLGVIRELTGKFHFDKLVSPEPATQWGGESGSTPGHLHPTCGGPVSCATGNYFDTETDLSVGGRGVGLDLARTYNSQAAAAGMHGVFGYGWSSSFSDHLVLEPTNHLATVVQAEGNSVPFTEGGGGSYSAPAWTPDTLSGSSEAGYTLTLANQVKYHFNGTNGRLESVTDRNGNATTLAYNSEGHPETITDPAGRKITFKYSGGLVESATDPMGNTVKYTYEGENLATVTEPGESSPRWRFKYDGSHEITKVIDGRGGETLNEYGGSKVASQTDPEGRKLVFAYETLHTTITNEATHSVTDERFTSQGEPLSITHGSGSPEASTQSYSYDEAGDVLTVTDGNGHTTKYGYDAASNRTSETNADGDEAKWTYDSTHDVVTTTTPKGETTTIKRDEHGNAESVSRPAPASATQTTKYTYDSHGNLTSVEDSLKRVWKYEYDAKGDRTGETDPEGDERSWSYNEDSQETSTVAPRGNVKGGEPAKYTTRIERDAQGRPLTLTEPLGEAAYNLQFGSAGTAAGQLNTPLAMATDPSGNLWVVDSMNNRLQKFSANGSFIEAIGFGVSDEKPEYEICTSGCHIGIAGTGSGQFHAPRGIAINQSTGNIYVADSANNRIEEFSSSASYVTSFGTLGSGLGNLKSPNGMTIDSSGNLWVADSQNNRIEEFSATGTPESVFGKEGSGNGELKSPQDIEISAGKLIVADWGNNRIEEFSTKGEYLGQFGTPGSANGEFSNPARIAVDPLNGDLYVSDNLNSRVQVFNSAGAFLGKFGSLGKGAGQFESLKSVAISATGTVYTADAGNERVEQWVGVSGAMTSYTYDANGNLETQTDPNGHTTTYVYDHDNEPTEVKEPDGAITKTAYDGAGQVESQTDGNKHTTKYVRDVLEQVTEVVDPLGRKTIKRYDLAGNLAKLTDAKGRTTTYVYDPANRLTEVSYSDGETPTVKYEYDKDGDRTKMTDGTGTTTHTYDQLDRLEETKDGHGDKAGYEYDLANEQTKITYPNGKAVTRAYDSTGRLHSVGDWLGHSTTFSYDPDSDLTTTTFPTGTSNVDEYAYNDTDQMSAVKMMNGSEALASLAYGRDGDGQVTNTITEGLPGEEATAYGYDANSRLTKAGAASYEYDAANNPTKTPGSTNTYNEADELTAGSGATYAYNEVGERTTTTPTSGPATSYGYDQAGNLTSVSRSKEGSTPAIEDAYAYNGEGLRASQTISGTTNYLTWDVTEDLPLIMNDGSNSYIYGPNAMPIEQVSAGGTVTYLHHDQAGSTRLVTGTTGTVEGKCTYGAYGGATCEGTATTPLEYDGQYTSPDTGLVYLRARTYDPATGQFLSVDPAGAITRAPYTYAGNNPLNGRDNRGLDIELGFVSIPTPNLEEIGNFAAGFGDTLTFGATQWVREELGINNVDTCSAAYQAGGYGGLAIGVLIPGEGEALGAGDVAAGLIREQDVLGAAERWLGEGYREIAPGVFRSADDARQFRATPSDLGAAHPHVHFESVGPGGRGNTENAHVYLGEW